MIERLLRIAKWRLKTNRQVSLDILTALSEAGLDVSRFA